jgi:hypothetical protein
MFQKNVPGLINVLVVIIESFELILLIISKFDEIYKFKRIKTPKIKLSDNQVFQDTCFFFDIFYTFENIL